MRFSLQTSQPVNQDKELIRINQFQLSLNENETSEITKSPCISDIRGTLDKHKISILTWIHTYFVL